MSVFYIVRTAADAAAKLHAVCETEEQAKEIIRAQWDELPKPIDIEQCSGSFPLFYDELEVIRYIAKP